MFGKNLMMPGNLLQLIDKKYLLNGFGVKPTDKNNLPDFKSLLHVLDKVSEAAPNQNITALIKSGKLGSGSAAGQIDNQILVSQVHVANSKGLADADTAGAGLAGLRQLFSELISHAQATDGKIEFEVENETIGKITVKFDPKNKILSVYSDNDEILFAPSELLSVFAGLDVSQVRIVDSKSEQLIAMTESKNSNQQEKPIPEKALQPANNFNIKTNSKLQEPVQSIDAALEKNAPMAIGVSGQDKQSQSTPAGTTLIKPEPGENVKNVVSTKQFNSDTEDATIKGAEISKPKLAEAKAVAAVQDIFQQMQEGFAKQTGGKIKVTVDVESKGKLVLESEKTAGQILNNVLVESFTAKEWLETALAQKGVQVKDIVVKIETPVDLQKDINPVVEIKPNLAFKNAAIIPDEASSSQSAFLKDNNVAVDEAKIEQVLNKVARIIRDLNKQDSLLLPEAEKKEIVQELQNFAAGLKTAVENGDILKHEIKVKSDEAAKWLEKQIQPVVEALSNQKVKIEKLVISKDGEIKSSIQAEIPAGLPENVNTKAAGGQEKPKPPLNFSAVNETSELKDNQQESKDDSILQQGDNQFKTSLNSKDTQTGNAKFETVEQIKPAHAISVSTSQGQVNFEAMNGKLVAARKIESSNMPEMMQKIAEITKHQASLSSHKLEVQMEVKEIGRVLVDALHQADKINLQIQVESTEARRLLEGQLRPLLENMVKEGLDIGKLEVSVRDEKAGEQMQNNLFHERQGSYSGKNAKSERYLHDSRPPAHHPEVDLQRLNEKPTQGQRLEVWA